MTLGDQDDEQNTETDQQSSETDQQSTETDQNVTDMGQHSATTEQNSTEQGGPSVPAVQAARRITDRGCQPREVAADALSVELQARINTKFQGLSAITAGLDGDGFWVQHRPEDWVYGVDYT